MSMNYTNFSISSLVSTNNVSNQATSAATNTQSKILSAGRKPASIEAMINAATAVKNSPQINSSAIDYRGVSSSISLPMSMNRKTYPVLHTFIPSIPPQGDPNLGPNVNWSNPAALIHSHTSRGFRGTLNNAAAVKALSDSYFKQSPVSVGQPMSTLNDSTPVLASVIPNLEQPMTLFRPSAFHRMHSGSSGQQASMLQQPPINPQHLGTSPSQLKMQFEPTEELRLKDEHQLDLSRGSELATQDLNSVSTDGLSGSLVRHTHLGHNNNGSDKTDTSTRSHGSSSRFSESEHKGESTCRAGLNNDEDEDLRQREDDEDEDEDDGGRRRARKTKIPKTVSISNA